MSEAPVGVTARDAIDLSENVKALRETLVAFVKEASEQFANVTTLTEENQGWAAVMFVNALQRQVNYVGPVIEGLSLLSKPAGVAKVDAASDEVGDRLALYGKALDKEIARLTNSIPVAPASTPAEVELNDPTA